MSRLIHISFTPDFKPGDPSPTGYMDWHAWAEVQHKAGLRQVKCPSCHKWRFPSELSAIKKRWARGRSSREIGLRIPVRYEWAHVCLQCATRASSPSEDQTTPIESQQ